MLASLLHRAAHIHLDIRQNNDKLKQRLLAAGVTLPEMSLAQALDQFHRATPVGAVEIWQLANALLRKPDASAITLRVDCPGQAATRHDELVVLSEYVAHLALCLAERNASGTKIVTRIEGECSGGIYVALAAGVATVEATPGARLRVLPEKAVAIVVGQPPLAETIEDALATGVVDRLVEDADDVHA